MLDLVRRIIRLAVLVGRAEGQNPAGISETVQFVAALGGILTDTGMRQDTQSAQEGSQKQGPECQGSDAVPDNHSINVGLFPLMATVQLGERVP